MSRALEASGVLHLLLSADGAAWRDCSACCRDEDCVVLLGDAVMVLARSGAGSIPGFSCRTLVSAPDAEARGVPAALAAGGFECIDDAGLVGLIEAHRYCLSWR